VSGCGAYRYRMRKPMTCHGSTSAGERGSRQGMGILTSQASPNSRLVKGGGRASTHRRSCAAAPGLAVHVDRAPALHNLSRDVACPISTEEGRDLSG